MGMVAHSGKVLALIPGLVVGHICVDFACNTSVLCVKCFVLW